MCTIHVAQMATAWNRAGLRVPFRTVSTIPGRLGSKLASRSDPSIDRGRTNSFMMCWRIAEPNQNISRTSNRPETRRIPRKTSCWWRIRASTTPALGANRVMMLWVASPLEQQVGGRVVGVRRIVGGTGRKEADTQCRYYRLCNNRFGSIGRAGHCAAQSLTNG